MKDFMFLHERLEAYQAARRFYRCARIIRENLPRGLGEVADQLKRASSSVCLALAEGANAGFAKMKVAHFQRALASAGECAGALDQVEDEEAASAELLGQARRDLELCARLTVGLLRRDRS
jgi:four helix bundle protein